MTITGRALSVEHTVNHMAAIRAQPVLALSLLYSLRTLSNTWSSINHNVINDQARLCVRVQFSAGHSTTEKQLGNYCMSNSLRENKQEKNKEIQNFLLDLCKYKQCSLLHHFSRGRRFVPGKRRKLKWKTVCVTYEHSAYTRCEPQAGYQQGLPRERGT